MLMILFISRMRPLASSRWSRSSPKRPRWPRADFKTTTWQSRMKLKVIFRPTASTQRTSEWVELSRRSNLRISRYTLTPKTWLNLFKWIHLQAIMELIRKNNGWISSGSNTDLYLVERIESHWSARDRLDSTFKSANCTLSKNMVLTINKFWIKIWKCWRANIHQLKMEAKQHNKIINSWLLNSSCSYSSSLVIINPGNLRPGAKKGL